MLAAAGPFPQARGAVTLGAARGAHVVDGPLAAFPLSKVDLHPDALLADGMLKPAPEQSLRHARKVPYLLEE